jgi:outer membrane protein OmpA-like peptidoglycan-associated protein
MKARFSGILGVVIGVGILTLLLGCAGQEQPMSMAAPPSAEPSAPPPPPQQITFPNGTVFGGASGRQASTLAKIMVDSNNNNMQEFATLQKKAGKNLELSQQTLDASEKNLQTSKQALALLENLMKQQGTADMTLFFPTGSSAIKEGTETHTRLVRLLDFVSVKSQGRKILFVLIGSASPSGSAELNARLSQQRAEAPVPFIDKYLLNAAHEYYKVYGLGDIYSEKVATAKNEEHYQNVRVIAVFETDQVPVLPEAPKS